MVTATGQIPSRQARTVARLFDRVSTVYDTPVLQAVVYRPAQDEIIAELGRVAASRIADVGCGTGILTARIAAGGEPRVVLGCDPSEGMLQLARRRCHRTGWIRCPAEMLPLAGHSLDAVVSSHAFHFFDQPAALAEFRRVLRPGGLVAVVMVNPHTRVGSAAVRAGLGRMGRFPDQRGMREMFVRAGFTAVRQRRVRRFGVAGLSPDVLTVATAG